MNENKVEFVRPKDILCEYFSNESTDLNDLTVDWSLINKLQTEKCLVNIQPYEASSSMVLLKSLNDLFFSAVPG